MKAIQSIFILSLAGMFTLGSCTSKRAKTIENIKHGIETETSASVKYAAYAQKATVEGFETIAKLFYAASKAEAIHASNHESVLKSFKGEMGAITPNFKVLSTLENLRESIGGESYEVDTMYPMFLADAKAKKLRQATIESLTWANETEKKHVSLFKDALKALEAKAESSLPLDYVICPVCGNTFDAKKKPEKCELCGANSRLFITAPSEL